MDPAAAVPSDAGHGVASDPMPDVMAAVAAAALLVVVIETAGGPRFTAILLVAALYVVGSVVGYRAAARRRRGAAVAFVAVQLVLGFAVFDAAGAGVGSTLLLLVLVVQAVLLLPLPWALAVAVLVPCVHVGMPMPDAAREVTSTAVAVGFAFALAVLHLRERRARADLADAHERLRRYAEQSEELATQTERTRLAREIHDGLGHHLTVVQMQVRAARTVLAEDVERADGLLGKAEDQAREALVEVRRSVAALRDPWESGPVSQALVALGDASAAAGLPASVRVVGTARRLPPEAERAVYRATQEGLTNARKHSGARAATVVLDYTAADVVRLRVEDDGGGSADRRARAAGAGGPAAGDDAPPDVLRDNGFGLTGVRERVEALGGGVRLGRSPSGGLALTVELPG